MIKQNKKKTFLPYGRQSIDQADIDAVIGVLRSDYLTTGPIVAAFEKRLAEHFDSRFVVCVNSGTAALHLAMRALGIGEGDWVIVPAITFLATANAARLCGAEVIFSDVDPDSGLMGPEQLKQVLENVKDKKVKGVAPVHLAGQTENLAEIHHIADQSGFHVIEDACHALGTQYDDGKYQYQIGCCQHSDAAIFSFHPVKTIAMGEGGAVVTHNKDLYQRVLQLRNHGMTCDREAFLHLDRATSSKGLENDWYYEMTELGLNYRVSDINCALGLSQLKKLDQFIANRRLLANYYDQLLEPLSALVKPINRVSYCKPAWHLYSILIDFDERGIERSYLMQALRERNIGTQVHYIPVNEQPYYQSRYGNTQLPGAQQYYARTLSLPLYPEMKKSDVEYVVQSLKEILENT